MPRIALALMGGVAATLLLGLSTRFTLAALTAYLGICLLSRASPPILVRRLRATRTFVDRAFPGEDVSVRLRVRNSSLLPLPWAELRDTVPPTLTQNGPPAHAASFFPRGEREVVYGVRCHRRGSYQLGPLAVRSGDILGLREVEIALPESSRLIVYPRVHPLGHLGLPTHSALALLPALSSLLEDTSRVVSLRGYRSDDPPRKIHWGATAHTGTLMVKQYARAVSRDTMVVLDLRYGAYETRERTYALELAIEVAASLTHHIIALERLAAGLITNGRSPGVTTSAGVRLPPGNASHHLVTILELLAGIEGGPGPPIDTAISQQGGAFPAGCTIVVVTGSASPALSGRLLELTGRGHPVALLLVHSPGQGQASPHLPGVTVRHIREPAGLVTLVASMR